MSPAIQTILALAVVALSGTYLARSLWRSLRGRPGGLGNCCTKGCAAAPTTPTPPRTQIVSADAFAARAAALAARRRRTTTSS